MSNKYAHALASSPFQGREKYTQTRDGGEKSYRQTTVAKAQSQTIDIDILAQKETFPSATKTREHI